MYSRFAACIYGNFLTIASVEVPTFAVEEREKLGEEVCLDPKSGFKLS